MFFSCAFITLRACVFRSHRSELSIVIAHNGGQAMCLRGLQRVWIEIRCLNIDNNFQKKKTTFSTSECRHQPTLITINGCSCYKLFHINRVVALLLWCEWSSAAPFYPAIVMTNVIVKRRIFFFKKKKQKKKNLYFLWLMFLSSSLIAALTNAWFIFSTQTRYDRIWFLYDGQRWAVVHFRYGAKQNHWQSRLNKDFPAANLRMLSTLS